MANSNRALGFQIKQYLVNSLKANGFKGNAEVAATGILGNLSVESGSFDPNVIAGKRKGDGGKATGLAQWHPNRWEPLTEWSKSQGMDPYTWQAQAAMIVHEMVNGTEKEAWRRLEKATSVQEAADAFLAFERPSGFKSNDPTGSSHYASRQEEANFYAGAMPDGMANAVNNGFMSESAPNMMGGGNNNSFMPQAGSPSMDLSQYTEEERDFIASMGLFKAAKENVPKLIELPNLLKK